MAKNKVSISFPEKKLYLYNHLKSKDNISSYICHLIEDDINKKSDDSSLEVKIKQIIDKILKDRQLSITTSSKNQNDICSEDNLTTNDIDIIKDLF